MYLSTKLSVYNLDVLDLLVSFLSSVLVERLNNYWSSRFSEGCEFSAFNPSLEKEALHTKSHILCFASIAQYNFTHTMRALTSVQLLCFCSYRS